MIRIQIWAVTDFTCNVDENDKVNKKTGGNLFLARVCIYGILKASRQVFGERAALHILTTGGSHTSPQMREIEVPPLIAAHLKASASDLETSSVRLQGFLGGKNLSLHMLFFREQCTTYKFY